MSVFQILMQLERLFFLNSKIFQIKLLKTKANKIFCLKLAFFSLIKINMESF